MVLGVGRVVDDLDDLDRSASLATQQRRRLGFRHDDLVDGLVPGCLVAAESKQGPARSRSQAESSHETSMRLAFATVKPT